MDESAGGLACQIQLTGGSAEAKTLQHMHVAGFAGLQVAGDEAITGLPVVERDAHFVVARWQRRDVNFAAQRGYGAGADASVALGDALTALVDDMHGKGVAGEQIIVFRYGNGRPAAAGHPLA